MLAMRGLWRTECTRLTITATCVEHNVLHVLHQSTGQHGQVFAAAPTVGTAAKGVH